MIKTIKHIISLIAITSILAISFIGCTQPTSTVPTDDKVQITFIDNVSPNGTKQKIVEKGYKLTKEDIPDIQVSDEYIFDGWFCNKTKINVGYEVNTNITLIAKASLVKDQPDAVKITYDWESFIYGESIPKSKYVKKGHVLTAEDLPSFKVQEEFDYEEDGWEYRLMSGSKKAKIGDVINSDTILVAKAKRIQVKITYVICEGVISEKPAPQLIYKNYFVEERHLPEVYVSDKFIFDGWYNGDTKVNLGDTFSSDVTLTCKLLDAVMIKYHHMEGVTFTPSPQLQKKVLKGSKLTNEDLPTITPDNGFNCDGFWYIGNEKATVGRVLNEDVVLKPIVYINDLITNSNFVNLGFNDKIEFTNSLNYKNLILYIELEGVPKILGFWSDDPKAQSSLFTIKIYNDLYGKPYNQDCREEILKSKRMTAYLSFTDMFKNEIKSKPITKDFSIDTFTVKFNVPNATTTFERTYVKDEDMHRQDLAEEAEKVLNPTLEAENKIVTGWSYKGKEIIFQNAFYKETTKVTENMILEPIIGER